MLRVEARTWPASGTRDPHVTSPGDHTFESLPDPEYKYFGLKHIRNFVYSVNVIKKLIFVKIQYDFRMNISLGFKILSNIISGNIKFSANNIYWKSVTIPCFVSGRGSRSSLRGFYRESGFSHEKWTGDVSPRLGISFRDYAPNFHNFLKSAKPFHCDNPASFPYGDYGLTFAHGLAYGRSRAR